MRYCLGDEWGPIEWVDFQGSLLPNSRMVHSLHARNPAKVVEGPAWMNKELLTKLKHFKKRKCKGSESRCR